MITQLRYYVSVTIRLNVIKYDTNVSINKYYQKYRYQCVHFQHLMSIEIALTSLYCLNVYTCKLLELIVEESRRFTYD